MNCGRKSLMSNSTATSILHSPASHTSYTRSTNPNNKRPPSKRTKSSFLAFINPRDRHDRRVALTPRSQHRSPQPAVNSLLEHCRVTPLEYDLSLNTSHILVVHRQGYSELSVEQLDAPATSPPVRFMSIACDALPWTIQVSSSNARNLTVGDVLWSLYRGLRSKANKTDWERLSSDTKRRVRDAWVARCMRQQSLRQRNYEESQGLRRVDFLCGNIGFMGLTCMSETLHEHQWLLHVSRIKRKVKFRANS